MRGLAVGLAMAGLVALLAVGSWFALTQAREDPEVVAPTPVPTATAPAPTPTPPPTLDPSPTPTPTLEPLEGPPPEGIDTLAEQVAALRGLAIIEPLDARVVPRADLGARFAEIAYAELDAEDIAGDERLLVALRLIDPDVDLLAIIESFYTEQVLGLYVGEHKILYIGADEPVLTPAQQVTAAHEVVHALQDQRWDLESLLDFPDEQSDEVLAAIALVEGDATLVQEIWAAQHQTPEERTQAREEALGRGSDAFQQAPRYVRDAILFPYREGPRFVQALVEHGGFEAVDEAFERLPRSTAEILDPQRYLAGQGPVEVTVTAEPGDAWEAASTYSFGAFDVAQLFAAVDGQGDAIAAGWAGGTVRHWQRGDADAVALHLRFDTEGDAAAACAATPVWYETVADASGDGQVRAGDRDWMAWTCGALDVRIGLGPDETTAAVLAEQ